MSVSFFSSAFYSRYTNITCFFFNDTATTEIYTGEDTLSLHDALPISFVCIVTTILVFIATVTTVAIVSRLIARKQSRV